MERTRQKKNSQGKSKKKSKSPRPKDKRNRKSKSPNPKSKGSKGDKVNKGDKSRLDNAEVSDAEAAKLKKIQEQMRLNKGKLAEKYAIKEKLGKGNFAVVRRVIRRIDGEEFAAKIISKKHLSKHEMQELEFEVNILQRIIHPNAVRLVEVLDTPRHLYLVLELLTGGELFDRIVARGSFSEQEAAQITHQIADALSYLHRIGIVHRDLKPENIIFATPHDFSDIKITDFGLAKYIVEDPNKPQIGPRKMLQTACGTPGYVAPEVLKQKGYNEYVDLWSTGVILYIMLCGFPPFSAADNPKNLYRKIKKGDYSFPSPAWDKISDIAKDCVRSLLTVDPRTRMSAMELLEHPWVKQANMQSPRNIVSKFFQRDLKNYLHRKRLRRGVELIITLNRMIRAAGLEDVAKKQRKEYRKRLQKVKIELKEKQRVAKQKLKEKYGDDYEKYEDESDIYPFDDTPPIDYSQV